MVHLSKTKSLQPWARAVSTAWAISATEAMPVEMIIGLPVWATRRISGKSMHSKDAILYAGTSRVSKKSTAVASNGELKHTRPWALARCMMGACQSQGVWAIW